MCKDESCVAQVVQWSILSNTTLLFAITHKFGEAYLGHHAGWIQELFSLVQSRLLIYDVSGYLNEGFTEAERSVSEFFWVDKFNSCMQIEVDEHGPMLAAEGWCRPMVNLLEIVYKLPDNVFWINVQGAPLSGNFCDLSFMARRFNRRRFSIHLNDEQPWGTSDCGGAALLDAYAQMALVLRDYYYGPFDSSALYIPLGSGRLPLLSPPEDREPIIISSERTVRCFFAGRLKYHSPGQQGHQREQMLQALSGPDCDCLLVSYEDETSEHLDALKYYNLMAETVFAPCPGGNNPETFRHYEVSDCCLLPAVMRQVLYGESLHSCECHRPWSLERFLFSFERWTKRGTF